MNADKDIRNVKIEDIIPNRFQPRLNFEQDGIVELAESIKQHGIIQPLVLRSIGTKFEIIAGERRYKASTMAGLEKVPALIVDLNDGESAEVALIENIQRRELTAIEEARSYKNIIDLGGLKQDELAKRMGKTQSTISNKLRLLNLIEEVQEALLKGKISERHARSLLVLKSENKQLQMLARIINERLTVRRTDEEVAKLNAIPDIEEEEFDIIEDIEDEEEVNVQLNNFTTPIENKIEENIVAEEFKNPFYNPSAEQLSTDENINLQENENEYKKENKFFNFFMQNKDNVDNNINETINIDKPVEYDQKIVPIEENNISETQMPLTDFNIFNQFSSNTSTNTNDEIQLNDVPTSNLYMENQVLSNTRQNSHDNVATSTEKHEPNVADLINSLPVYENAGDSLKNTQEFAPVGLESKGTNNKVQLDPNNFTTIIKSFRELVNQIEDLDFYIEGEETDFEDYYQFVIKIDKERL